MLGVGWSVQSPVSASVLADRIRTEPRWNPNRDGWFAGDRFLITDQYPVEVRPDGFRFHVPTHHHMVRSVVCRGRFVPSEGGTRVELRAALPLTIVVIVAVMVFLFMAVIVIGLWSVNPWLAIGLAVAGVSPGVLVYVGVFWVVARRVRSRVTDCLTRASEHRRASDPVA